MNYLEIHENTVASAKDLKRAEGKLIDNLQLVDKYQVFRKLNYASLHAYAVEALELSSDQAVQFIRVARKAVEVPELKEAIQEHVLNVSTARRILTVITPDNKTDWLEKASTLTQKELEREVVKHNPREAVRERIKPLTENLSHLQCSIPRELEEMLERIKDLESQRTRKSCDLVSALTESCKAYLEKHDPVLKAERNLSKKKSSESVTRQVPTNFPSASRQVPANVKHQVNHRDRGQCAHVDLNGKRCPNRRWVQMHHIKQYTEGGKHTPENLITLCHYHHRIHHTALAAGPSNQQELGEFGFS